MTLEGIRANQWAYARLATGSLPNYSSSMKSLSLAARMALSLFVLALPTSHLQAQEPGSSGDEKKGKPAGEEKDGKKKELPPAVPLSKAATAAIKVRYLAAEHWMHKAVSLMSLNHYWAPVGSEMILKALQDKDNRLNAFGLEALRRSEKGLLPTVVSPALLEELIGKQLREKNELYHKRLLEVLSRIAPEAKAKAKDKSDWQRWWRENKKTWQPKPWTPKDDKPQNSGGTVVVAADRALDLHDAGLDLAICIDSTGSMQSTINALADALGHMVDLLDGISPRFRLGLVHYKDGKELDKNGAEIILPLSKNVRNARKKLLKLRAFGGGDLPEAVLGGMAVTYSRRMKWKAETNKLVIVIGDAPPHDGDEAKAIKLAEEAYKTPDRVGDKPTTGFLEGQDAPVHHQRDRCVREAGQGLERHGAQRMGQVLGSPEEDAGGLHLHCRGRRRRVRRHHLREQQAQPEGAAGASQGQARGQEEGQEAAPPHSRRDQAGRRAHPGAVLRRAVPTRDARLRADLLRLQGGRADQIAPSWTTLVPAPSAAPKSQSKSRSRSASRSRRETRVSRRN